MEGDAFKGEVGAIHSFRDYMEQMIFDSRYSLNTATLLEDVS